MYVFGIFCIRVFYGSPVSKAEIGTVIIIYDIFFFFQRSHIQQDGMEIYLKKDFMQYTGNYDEIYL